MNDEHNTVCERELVEIRKLAMQIASKHDEGYVVGVSRLVHNADAITVYIVTGSLPPMPVAVQPLQGGS